MAYGWGDPQLVGIDSGLNPEGAHIAMGHFQELLGRSHAENHAVIMDCLTLNPRLAAGEKMPMGDSGPLEKRSVPGEWLLRRREQTDHPERGSDPFMESVIDGFRLGEADQDEDGSVTMADLSEFLKMRMRSAGSLNERIEITRGSHGVPLAKASVCGLAYDIFISKPALSPDKAPAPDPEVIQRFLDALHMRLDAILERPTKIYLPESHLQPGSNFEEAVGTAVRSSGVMLAMLTGSASESGWLEREVHEFREARRTETSVPRMFAFTVGDAHGQRLIEETDFQVKSITPETLEAEVHAAAEAIATTLLTLRRDMVDRNADSMPGTKPRYKK
jgi:hypothetical protein